MTRAESHLFVSSPFANGIEKNKKENLLASVLRALRDHNIPHEEWRGIAPIKKGVESDAVRAPDAADLSRWIDEWDADRERIQESRTITKPIPQGLQFVSWRGLHSYSLCPLQYYYRYIAGIHYEVLTGRDEIPDEEAAIEVEAAGVPKGMTPEEFGGFVHRALYEWLSTKNPDDQSARQTIESLAGRYRLKGSTRKHAVAIAQSLVTSYRNGMPWQAQDIYKMEWPVQLRLSNTVFHGVTDRVDRHENGLRVIDYKIGTQREEYAYQIRFYAWILDRSIEGNVLKGSIVYVHRDPKVVDVDVSAGELGHVGTTAERLADAASSGDYPAAPGVVCAACDFREMCPHAVA
jgi:CRISPR/Cas system-associated exonuclease Cas4 (RecB family)